VAGINVAGPPVNECQVVSPRKSGPDGLVFRGPAGFAITGRLATLPGDPVAALVAQNAQEGLEIDARTNAIQWWGEPLDAYWAVERLRAKDPLPCPNPESLQRDPPRLLNRARGLDDDR
jgi:hypothetical protein